MDYRPYDTIYLEPFGMLSVQRFPTPRNNRKVQFILPPTKALSTDIYLHIDGQFQSKVFSNNSAVSTSVTIGEFFYPRPHESFAILVNKAPVQLECVQPKIHDISLTYNGYQVDVKFQSNLQATIQCSNTLSLAKDYFLTNPEVTVRNDLVIDFGTTADKVLAEYLKDDLLSAKSLVNDLPGLSEQIQKKAIQKMYQKYRWLTLSQVSFSIELLNGNDLTQLINKKIRDEEDARRKLFEAIIESLGKPQLTPELTELIKAYIHSQPTFDEKETFSFIERMRPLLQTYPSRMIESVMAEELGIDGFGKGFSYESLL